MCVCPFVVWLSQAEAEYDRRREAEALLDKATAATGIIRETKVGKINQHNLLIDVSTASSGVTMCAAAGRLG
jgi:hypothetical protein